MHGAAEREAFAGRLAAMERDGQLMTNRKGELCVAAKLDLVTGTVQGHPDGFGFLVPDDGGPDLFLAPKEMHKVLHGDRATARPIGTDRRGRPEGEIVDVLERAQPRNRRPPLRGARHLVRGRREQAHQPGHPGARRTCAATREPGQVVVAEIDRAALGAPRGAGARSCEVLGNYTDPGMEIEIALRKHDLPHEFSAAAKRQATRLPDEVRAADRKGRVDLRALPLVTIDGETARDFDDAVYCERVGKGFRLIVAIADVSHYVRDGDALDRDARERGTSVYFPRRVIPMLPEALSNELCSLKPEVDRLCMVCDMAIDARRQHRPLQVLSRGDAFARAPDLHAGVGLARRSRRSATEREAQALLPQLVESARALQVPRRGARARGAIDFDTVELALDFDAHGKIEAIVPVVRNDAHKLIEECMLAANVCTAEFLLAHKQPALYRVHEGPTPEKLDGAQGVPRELRPVARRRRQPDADRLRELLRAHPRPARLRPAADGAAALAAAGASTAPDNVGHFGLGYDAYTHFTSPIRRYPDLLVHRCDQGLSRRRALSTRPARRGPSSACTARRPSAAPTTPRATSRTGSSATSCRTMSARPSPAPSAASRASACS